MVGKQRTAVYIKHKEKEGVTGTPITSDYSRGTERNVLQLTDGLFVGFLFVTLNRQPGSSELCFSADSSVFSLCPIMSQQTNWMVLWGV